jgi:hypothetical protein
VFPLKKFPVVQAEHSEAVVPVQALHLESQAVQDVPSKNVAPSHGAQVVPVLTFPAAHAEHSVFDGPVHAVHAASQALQVLSVASGY